MYSDGVKLGQNRGEGVTPLSVLGQLWYFSQLVDCGKLRFPTIAFFSKFCSAYNLSDFCLLHCQWASCKFLMSDGCPFLFTGMMWSITGDSGWGYLSDLSTGWPQIPQVFWVLSNIFLFFSNATRCGPLRSARSSFIVYLDCLLCFISSCTPYPRSLIRYQYPGIE